MLPSNGLPETILVELFDGPLSGQTFHIGIDGLGIPLHRKLDIGYTDASTGEDQSARYVRHINRWPTPHGCTWVYTWEKT